LIDRNVYNIFYRASKFIPEDCVYYIDAVEKEKNIETVLDFVRFLVSKKFTKKSKLIVVGGGITQDIAAFSAAVYKRGIKWVFFPTTLLSMCDSCIGGKTGINFESAKNQLALFSSPTAVYLAPYFLSTLKEQDIKSGLGEALKLFNMAGPAALETYKECVDEGVLTSHKTEKLIREALKIKKAVVEEDEFELGNRTALNYGHTVGHALEAATKYSIPHGQAIAIGLVVADEVSGNHNQEVKKLVSDLVGNLKNIDLDYEEVFSFIKKDRKVFGDTIKIVTCPSSGKIVFKESVLDEKFKDKVIESLKFFFK
jgi:3-dehydroquinate synthase